MNRIKHNNQINQAIRYSPIIKHILEDTPKKILEIGCGSQGIGRFLDINFDGLDLTTSDYGLNEKLVYEGMHFIKGSALDIPLENNSYDFVYSCDMLEHIKKSDRIKTIDEAIRVCKKGGYIIFCFPCGITAKIFDYSLFYFFKLIRIFYKKITIPGRLTEHVNIDYPMEGEIKKYKKMLKEKQCNISSYCANNIFRWAIIMFIDLTRFSKLRNKIIDIYITNPKSCRSIFPYRKYLIIKK